MPEPTTTVGVIVGAISMATLALLSVDYVADPDRLARPIDAARSAGYFWQSSGLSALADKGDFLTVVKRINGGYNGLSERQMLWADAKAALGLK